MTNVRNQDQTHKQLLDAGFQAFLKNGFDNTKIREICRDAHRTTGSFYQHFKSKAEILDEILDPFLHQLDAEYNKQFKTGMNKIKQQNVQQIWQQNILNMNGIIKTLNANPNYKELILFKADGSKYDRLSEILTKYFTQKIIIAIDTMQERSIIPISFKFNYQELHFHVFAFYATFVDILKHQYSEAETIMLCNNLYTFFYPGWATWLEI